ncbi:MAG: undecaprenyl/decaprenyl-phosphate alpha-N-acetylglucosaminyl 1-phosphate transferase [Desulfobacterales bacterium]|nr:undecaprenyl/decaprenyl-phosphate alpha-N-acetylglucosaminyl 1-phosphate transferase [Desulfobacterales bacterium]
MKNSKIIFFGGKVLYFLVLAVFIFLLVPFTRNSFFGQGHRWFLMLLLSFSISFTVTPWLRYLAKKVNILDYPDNRKVHHQATPLLGGIAIYIAFVSSIFINNIYTKPLLGILIGGTIVFLISAIDDIIEIPAGPKLLAQFLATSIIIGSGIVLDLFPKTPLGDAGNVFLTLLWVIGITNSFNFFDGMDGLASGLGIITAFFIGIISFQTDQPFLGWIAISVMGSCIGFFPYNFRLNKPATIFMGDSGSNFLGFTLASLAIFGEWADNNPIVSMATPLLIFWVFVFDMTHITLTRIVSGKVTNFKEWINYVGKDHLHHRLEFLLKSKKQSVLFIFFLCACMGISAIVLRYARTVDAVLLVIQAVIIVILVTILEARAKKQANKD